MCGFDGVRRGNYFGGELIRRAEIEVRVGRLKNGKMKKKKDPTTHRTIDELIRKEEQNGKQKKEKETGNGDPTKLYWAIRSPLTTRIDYMVGLF